MKEIGPETQFGNLHPQICEALGVDEYDKYCLVIRENDTIVTSPETLSKLAPLHQDPNFCIFRRREVPLVEGLVASPV